MHGWRLGSVDWLGRSRRRRRIPGRRNRCRCRCRAAGGIRGLWIGDGGRRCSGAIFGCSGRRLLLRPRKGGKKNENGNKQWGTVHTFLCPTELGGDTSSKSGWMQKRAAQMVRRVSKVKKLRHVHPTRTHLRSIQQQSRATASDVNSVEVPGSACVFIC